MRYIHILLLMYAHVCICSLCVAYCCVERASRCLFLLAHMLQMCFWVEREVLEERNLKLRGETVAFFIRVAKVCPPLEVGGKTERLSIVQPRSQVILPAPALINTRWPRIMLGLMLPACVVFWLV